MVNGAVLCLHGQLRALTAPGAISGSSGTSLKEENHASFWWLELLQGKRVTEAQDPPLKITRGYSIYLEQIYEKCGPRDSPCPESNVLASWVATVTFCVALVQYHLPESSVYTKRSSLDPCEYQCWLFPSGHFSLKCLMFLFIALRILVYRREIMERRMAQQSQEVVALSASWSSGHALFNNK